MTHKVAIATKPDRGRCVVATQTIQKGELIIASQAIAAVPYSCDKLEQTRKLAEQLE